MKIIKKIGIGLAALIALLLLAALFVPKEYAIAREISITKPQHEVFEYVRHLKNMDHYNIWVQKDPAAKKDFRGTDGSKGFVYAWNSRDNDVGEGEQEIRNLRQDEAVDMELRFKRPFENTATTSMQLAPVSGASTKLKWEMRGRNPYPMNLFNLLIDGMLGKDMESSLINLKTLLEK